MSAMRALRKFVARITGLHGFWSGKYTKKNESGAVMEKEVLAAQRQQHIQQKKSQKTKKKKIMTLPEESKQEEYVLFSYEEGKPFDKYSKEEEEPEDPSDGLMAEMSLAAFSPKIVSIVTPTRDTKFPSFDEADEKGEGVSLSQTIPVPETPLPTKNLLNAASENDLDAVRFLVKNEKIDVNSQDPADGYGALFVAAEEGHVDLVAWLVRNGADVERVDSEGRTPLFAAAVANQGEVVEFLIREAGAKADVKNKAGRHVFWATCALELVDVAASLLDASASRGLYTININAKDVCGLSALGFARRMNHESTVEFLMRRGARDPSRGNVARLSREWDIRQLDAIINST